MNFHKFHKQLWVSWWSLVEPGEASLTTWDSPYILVWLVCLVGSLQSFLHPFVSFFPNSLCYLSSSPWVVGLAFFLAKGSPCPLLPSPLPCHPRQWCCRPARVQKIARVALQKMWPMDQSTRINVRTRSTCMVRLRLELRDL